MPVLNRRVIAGVILCEVVLVALFLAALQWSGMMWAVTVLAIPLQLLVVAVLSRSDFGLLLFFSVLYPLAILALLPHAYVELGLFIGVLGLVVVLVFLDLMVGTRSALGLGRLESLALLVIAGAAIAASLFAQARGYGFRHSHLFTLMLVLVATAVYAVVPGSSRQLRILVVTVVVAYAVACLAVPPFLARVGGFVGRKTFDTLFGRPNLNLVGMVASAGAAIMLGFLPGSNRGARVIQAAALAVLVAIVLVSRSRGAWLAFGVAVMYFLVRMRSLRYILVVAGLVALLMTQDILRLSFEVRAEQTGSGDPSMLGRFVIWRTAFDMFRANWVLGVGVENFRYLKFSYGFPMLMDPKYWHGTHNMFLEQFVSLGVLGGGAFLALPIVTLVRLDRLVRRIRGSERSLAVGLSAGLLAFFTHCMLDSPGWDRASFVFWGVLLGLSIAATRLLDVSGREARGVSCCQDVRSSPAAGGGSVEP